MAFENSNFSKTYRAASAIAQYQAVAMLGAVTAASALDETVVPAAAAANPILGVSRASAAVGDAVTVDLAPGYVKMLCAASLGAGAFVGITGATWSVAPVAAASIGVKSIGQAEQNAAAGDVFTVRLNPSAFL
jgi:hypothetical protein